MYIIPFGRILQTSPENSEKLGNGSFNYDLSSEAWKNISPGLKTPQNCIFSSHLFLRQSWTNVLGHFCISGVFSNSWTSNPSPHPTNNVGHVYPEFFRVSTLYRVGGGRTTRKLQKGCTVLRGNREWQKNMNIAVLSLIVAFTSPDVISTSPKSFLTSRFDFTVLLLFKFLKKHHLPVGQVKNRIH